MMLQLLDIVAFITTLEMNQFLPYMVSFITTPEFLLDVVDCVLVLPFLLATETEPAPFLQTC
jgi:hypothetical protein